MKNMPKVQNAATTRLAAGLRLILSGLIALLLVSSAAGGQSGQLPLVPVAPPPSFPRIYRPSPQLPGGGE
jgi:hypothetical protein